MTPLPHISVIVPCYNGAAFLRETLQSVIYQTYAPLEILFIDDGSTDNSAEIAAEFGPAIRVIRQENQGESVARNRGIDEARGDWIALLDADDLWHPEKLEKQIDVIGRYVGCVHTNYYNFGEKLGECDYRELPADKRYGLEHILLHGAAHISSMLVRRDMSPRFPTWTRYGEDRIYQAELAQRGVIRLVPEPLCGYRRHDRSQSRSDPKIDIHWHETVVRWLTQYADLPKQTVDTMLSALIDSLADAAHSAKWHRQWDRYWEIRNYLKRYSERRSVLPVVREWILPRLAYQVSDFMKSARSSKLRRA